MRVWGGAVYENWATKTGFKGFSVAQTKRMLVLRPEILTEDLNQSASGQDDGILINGPSIKLPPSTYPFMYRFMQLSPLIAVDSGEC